jgi:multimeric flavodoxin WrbA
MKLLTINGSPRKKWNTAILLENVIEGAKSQGAETELVHLYDLNYKGCISCFACKLKDGKSYGKCAVKDDIAQLFKKIEEADAVVIGSPIYLGNATGEMRSFLERLVFQYLTYTDPPGSLFPKQIKTGFIYTMGVPEEIMNQWGL